LDDGTLFFNSSDALVPSASGGQQNVYEYNDGQVYAISDVASGYPSFFMDASASGEDVFFASANEVLPGLPTSGNVAVYDARVDGGFPVSISTPSCESGDGCKPAPSSQPSLFGAGPSETFKGPGNLAPPPAVAKPKPKTVKCPKGRHPSHNKSKGKHPSHNKCMKSKHRKRKSKAKRSAHTNRRTRS